MIKTPSGCPSYNGCEAPLCPLSEELDSCVWYPDEEVCMAIKFTKVHWIRTQKKLRKYKISVDKGYFTKKMLDGMKYCTRKTRGINPDVPLAKGLTPPEDTPIPEPRSYKKPLKSQEGHCGRGSGIKEGQLILIQ